MIGGGVAKLPTSFFNTGFIFGIIINLVIMMLTFLSCYLYLQTKDLLQGLDSISHIAFKLFGRISIFFMNSVIFILVLGSITIYFRLFGETCRDVVRELVTNPVPGSWYLNEKYYILIIAVINLSTIYMK